LAERRYLGKRERKGKKVEKEGKGSRECKIEKQTDRTD